MTNVDRRRKAAALEDLRVCASQVAASVAELALAPADLTELGPVHVRRELEETVTLLRNAIESAEGVLTVVEEATPAGMRVRAYTAIAVNGGGGD